MKKSDFIFGFIPGSFSSVGVSEFIGKLNLISGLDVSGIINAFLIGLAGGLGGWIIKRLLDRWSNGNGG